MDRRRIATVSVALCGTMVLAGWVVARTAGLSSAAIENSGAIVSDHRTVSFSAAAEFADVRPPISTDNADIPKTADLAKADIAKADIAKADVVKPDIAKTDIAKADIVKADIVEADSVKADTVGIDAVIAAKAETQTTPDVSVAAEAPIVVAALPDSAQILPPETPLSEAATASTPDLAPNEAKAAVRPIEIPNDCAIVDACIDRYLWALYARTPKEDTNKVQERRQVTVKRRGKMITVTRSFTKLVDADFTWKDPKAAERAGMPMIDYVIGGMDRSFKLKLFNTLRAAEQAGLSPGITSAFRDDYRQSIAEGLKAASNRSFHGGSLRGGYGHGLAADVVSVNGGTRDERWNASERLWKWIDANGKEFGIGRPYLNRDPPHVAPVDGSEYVSRRGGVKTRVAASVTKRNHVAVRDTAKTSLKPSQVRTGSTARVTRQGKVADRPTPVALKRG